ncbi:hypothetical protein [Sphingomonas soli]|uniref:hypothetical protein n=1 Tax=Sphingomonas soli TaxID=266127 RepID=UPI000835FC92|nr:hypothetical protein [Sphingomonas soli]
MLRTAFLAATAWFGLSAPSEPRAIVTPVDPLTVQDDDFARHRDPAEWKGLKVSRIEFREERAHWRLWRIESKRPGPLWFVPHDNENGGFEAAFAAIRKYGGTIVAVDSGVKPGADGVRMNHAVDYGRPIDPNRNFDDALPFYARTVLAGRGDPIIALHTNSPGFASNESLCNRSDPVGRGVISIRFCDDTLTPSPSVNRAWPWDDDDSVAFATYRTGQSPSAAYCRDQMVAMDFNVVQERVITSDGSLSNYSVLRGVDYLNFETQDRGLSPEGLAEMRDRLMAMIDRALAACAPGIMEVRRR